MEFIVNKIDFKILNNDEFKEKYSFGYIENENYTLWIFVAKEKKINEDKLLNKILELGILKYIENPIYSKENINKIIFEINLEIMEEKLINNIDTHFSMIYLISDYNSIFFSVLGDFNIKILRNKNIYYELENYSTYLSSENIKIVSLNDKLTLLKDDNILIQSKNIIDNISFENESIQLKKELNEKYFLASMKFNDILERSIYENKNNFVKIIFLIFFIILSYIFFNIYYVKYIFNYMENRNKFYLEKIKKLDLNDLDIEINLDLKIINKLNKKYILLLKKDIEKKELYIFNANKILNEYNKLKEILKKLNEVEEYIYERNFEKALEEYMKEKIIIENFNTEIKIYGVKLEERISILKKLLDNKKREDKYIFDENNIVKSFKEYEDILNTYKKFNLKIYIDDIYLNYEKYKKDVENLKLRINELIIEAEILKVEDIIESKNKYIEIIEILKDLDEKNKLKEMEEKLKQVIEEIEYNKSELDKNYNFSLKEYDDKNYKSALEYIILAKENALKLKEYEKIKEINSRIIFLNKKIDEIENIKQEKDFKDKNIFLEMKKSMNLSINKGDEYLKQAKYSEAIIEYERALEIMNKLNIDFEIKNKTNKKIEFAKNRLNKKWWEVWK